MKNGFGLKIGMAGIISVSLHKGIFNNHNPSQVFVQAKANATSIQIASPYAFEPAWTLSRKFKGKAQYTFQCKDRL